MDDDDERDDGITDAQQDAFCEVRALIEQLVADPDYTRIDVGKGALVAAVSYLRKILSEEEISRIFYEYADDYATRKLSD